MSNIKAANSASEPVVSTEKELQLVKQQQEIRASETLFQKLSKTVTKQQEKTDSTHTDDQQEQPKDTAEISESRRRLSANGRDWTAEELICML